MGKPHLPPKVKLVCGILTADKDLARRGRQLLTRVFGPVDTEAGPWSFDTTDYYEAESGTDLQRFFVSFAHLDRPERLAEIKRATNDIEALIAEDCEATGPPRPVNLDPGYITLDKLVLATTKGYSHRIYLGTGIYAEVTLRYEKGRWQPWPWTYPDYAQDTYHAFFTSARDTLHEQLQSEVPA